jgi:hypothetical protein
MTNSRKAKDDVLGRMGRKRFGFLKAIANN